MAQKKYLELFSQSEEHIVCGTQSVSSASSTCWERTETLPRQMCLTWPAPETYKHLFSSVIVKMEQHSCNL